MATFNVGDKVAPTSAEFEPDRWFACDFGIVLRVGTWQISEDAPLIEVANGRGTHSYHPDDCRLLPGGKAHYVPDGKAALFVDERDLNAMNAVYLHGNGAADRAIGRFAELVEIAQRALGDVNAIDAGQLDVRLDDDGYSLIRAGSGATLFSWSDAIYGKFSAPSWSEARRVHDWRNYLPEEARLSWSRFDILGRLTMAWIAEIIAGREEWD